MRKDTWKLSQGSAQDSVIIEAFRALFTICLSSQLWSSYLNGDLFCKNSNFSDFLSASSRVSVHGRKSSVISNDSSRYGVPKSQSCKVCSYTRVWFLLSLMVMRKVKNYKRWNKVFFHQTKMYEYDHSKEIAKVFHHFRGPLSLYCQTMIEAELNWGQLQIKLVR